LLDLVHAVAPAQLDQRVGLHCIDQVFLQVLLLQIDHGKEAVIVGTRVLHAKHTLAAVDAVAVAPGQSGLRHALGHAHLLQVSMERRVNTMARLPSDTCSSDSSTTQRWPWRAISSAVVRPTGPVPTMTMGWFARRMPGGKPGLMHLVLVVDGAAWLGIGLMHVLVSWGRCRDQTSALSSPCGLACNAV
jgi:hypothetical protein